MWYRSAVCGGTEEPGGSKWALLSGVVWIPCERNVGHLPLWFACEIFLRGMCLNPGSLVGSILPGGYGKYKRRCFVEQSGAYVYVGWGCQCFNSVRLPAYSLYHITSSTHQRVPATVPSLP